MKKFWIFILIVFVSLIFETLSPYGPCWAARLKTEGTLELACPAPIILGPKNGETIYTKNPILMWSPPPGVPPGDIIEYQVRMGVGPYFTQAFYVVYVTGTMHVVNYRDMDTLQYHTIYWDVRARVRKGWGAWSEAAMFKVNLSFLPPPQLVRPIGDVTITELAPTFEWISIPNATHYSIQISENSEFSGPIIRGTTTSTTFRPYTNLKENTRYYWRICGLKDNISSSYSEVGIFHITTARPPITLLSPPNGSRISHLEPPPSLSWRSVPGGGGYNVQLSTNRDFTDATTYTIYHNYFNVPSNRLENEKTYYWRVKQEVAGEWRSIDSIWSFTVRVIPEPTGLTYPRSGAKINDVRPTLRWREVPYATSYQLELREDDWTGPIFFSGRLYSTTSFTVRRTLSFNKRYIWFIRSCNRHNECSGPGVGWFEVGISLEPPRKAPEAPPIRPPIK